MTSLTNLASDKIIEVESANGHRFRIGQVVAHDDEDAGTATILSFKVCEKCAPDLVAVTDRGEAHIAFCYPVHEEPDLKPLPDYGDHMTWEEFANAVKGVAFID